MLWMRLDWEKLLSYSVNFLYWSLTPPCCCCCLTIYLFFSLFSRSVNWTLLLISDPSREVSTSKVPHVRFYLCMCATATTTAQIQTTDLNTLFLFCVCGSHSAGLNAWIKLYGTCVISYQRGLYWREMKQIQVLNYM